MPKNSSSGRVFAVVVAAGRGSRVGGPLPKQYLSLAGRPVLERSLQTLGNHDAIAAVLPVIGINDAPLWRDYIDPNVQQLCRPPVIGGQERFHSVLNALEGLLADEETHDTDWVLIHDAARPGLSNHDLDRMLASRRSGAGVVLGIPVADTLRRTDVDGVATETIDRRGMWRVQTPQMFPLLGLLAAYKTWGQSDLATDDAQVAQGAGMVVRMIEGGEHLLKVTFPGDVARLEQMLGEGGGVAPFRIGQGFDVHALVSERRLILGGVNIPFERGLLGHSDADVLLHAIADALLGAAGLGDIGHHFPDTDSTYAGADSRVLLRRVMELVQERGYRIGNLDATVIAQRPKIAPYIEAMRSNVAEDLAVEIGAVNIKATTTEKLGFTGRGEGIAAQALVTLVSR
ncbi:MAG: bifunctional 2-C-methyl-D-erythritol 4-phosphate cytidylyltransferase/2-C-methyl-D-erythritol 2,4-cyclodiphosphate synthase [Alphaproteobacteria bacterium CG_4_10_14_0_2_um_filter_63_37]|nr:MAG: hypothetical protein AUJ55_06565 [Proteobacteria bacterium CG1_02_64_396]PJA26090.1 MAG: bifunctional 2-C-methyl-D-erythritol 4-phosphate cytidylyltransferase/2-C-methyl-D-erythritol 2,4-cyclodiphosphate synthase [Alphaproteobacteria bacterium CG_4_10_14_0_2_um_filter_63_37]